METGLSPNTVYALAAAAGYILGSIPFGLVLTRMAGLGDIRDIGSGNIGATNVLRTGNKFLAAVTLIADCGKGAAALLIAHQLYGPDAGLIAGFMAVIGHNFPVWLKFKGGKGVATTLGVLLIAYWPVGVAACAIWLLTAAIFRYSSLAALVALASSPLVALYAFNYSHLAIMAAGLAILGFIRHHENIKRLVRGEESKIGKKG
jgi:glycerol-3-phosphate acyltransferase PlsY